MLLFVAFAKAFSSLFPHTLQESWCKEYSAAANVVANLGNDAINMLGQFEKAGTHLTGGLLRAGRFFLTKNKKGEPPI